ncbi:uncharacterized protein LOC124256285 isoform X1 [Haliotis rubra]|uniref:uncharacterized protein LOC124256285 isoform X1 n=1 Tax=Haliotis rubra TaxID=36100 RepID=UPI001EE616FF|nr:uncharacterized protein LOC124256285 isoform X1 [Haliotis rubra]
MASSQDIVCRCKNTCTRVSKRGTCPCRAAGKLCSSLCSCGWMVPCVNKPDCQPPKLKSIDVDFRDFTDRDVISTARDDMDGDINHTPPQHNPTKKRKRKTADGSRVRRRLNVDQVPVEADSTDDLEAASTTCINDLEAAPTTNTSSSSCPPKGPSAHHKAVKDFAASLDVTELRSIVTELLFRDQGLLTTSAWDTGPVMIHQGSPNQTTHQAGADVAIVEACQQRKKRSAAGRLAPTSVLWMDQTFIR